MHASAAATYAHDEPSCQLGEWPWDERGLSPTGFVAPHGGAEHTVDKAGV